MHKSPAFQFYPADFLSDENVALMSLAGRGAYITLLCYCWREGSIPSDIDRLARLCGTDSSAMAQLWGELSPCFEIAINEPSRLIHSRLETERIKQAAHSAERQESGKKGALKRWGNSEEPKKKEVEPRPKRDSSAITQLSGQLIANDAFSSISSSSSSTVKDSTTDKSVVVSLPDSTPADQVFEHWKTSLNHPRSILDAKRRRLINERLKEGFSVEDLKLAIDGCKQSPFHQGQNDRHQIYDDISLICRDAAKVEQFMTCRTVLNGAALSTPRTAGNIAAIEAFLADGSKGGY